MACSDGPVTSFGMDLWGAVVGGFVSGLVTGAFGATVVIRRTTNRTKSTGERSPTAQSQRGHAVAAGGDVNASLIGDVHFAPKPSANLVPFLVEAPHGMKELRIRNEGLADALNPTWEVRGERHGVRIVPSQTPTLPSPMGRKIELAVGLVIYSISSAPHSPVEVVVTWEEPDGASRSSTLPV